MKAKSRFLGIDDAPFRFSDERVPIVGVVVQAPSYIEGVLTTLAEVDGHDATERIAAMVRRSRYHAGLAAILIDGTAVVDSMSSTSTRSMRRWTGRSSPSPGRSPI